MTVQLGEDLEIKVCRARYRIPHTLETLMRVERVVGAAALFAQRMDRRDALHEEIAGVYHAVLEGLTDGPPAPSLEDIDEWVFKVGLAGHDDLAVFLMSLTLGRKTIDRVIRYQTLRRTAADAEKPDTATGGSRA